MKFFSRKNLLAGLLTLTFCVFILPVNERLAFTIPPDRKTQLIAAGLKPLFAIFLFLIVHFTLTFIERLRAGDEDYKRWLKYAAIYFGIMLVVFLLIYPGHFVWDEFQILNSVKVYGLNTWQGFLTNVYYTFNLYLVPTAVSIVVFQMVFASLTIGYVVMQVRKLVKNQRLALLLFLLFLLPPIVLNNFYPLRLTAYSYVELLLVSRLIFLYFNKFKVVDKYRELLIFTGLIMMVSYWRSEGMYYLLLFPVMVYLLGIFDRRHLKRITPLVYTGACLLILAFGLLLSRFAHDARYDLTAAINPLSVMIQKPLHGDNVDARLKTIDKTLDVGVLKKYPDTEEVPSYWVGVVREGYQAHLDSFNQQYAYLVLHNPGPFLSARLKTFLSANGFGKAAPFVGRNQITPFAQDYDAAVTTRFENENYLATPLDVGVKKHVTQALLEVNDEGRFNLLGHILWNVIPIIILLLALGVWKLIKRQYFWLLPIGLVLLRVPLLFATEPANYFMYYLPVYIVGGFILMLQLVLYVDKRHPALATRFTGRSALPHRKIR